MRTKLIKLLRKLESESAFHNEYFEYSERYNCDYKHDEYIDLPNYKAVTGKYNELYKVTRKQVIIPTAESNIRAELTRMEADGLIMISIQDAKYFAVPVPGAAGPDEEGDGKSESIILTTKGKSQWRYFWYKAWDNPVTTVLSIVAVCISLYGLFQ